MYDAKDVKLKKKLFSFFFWTNLINQQRYYYMGVLEQGDDISRA